MIGRNPSHVVLFIASYGDGGVERMLVNTANGLSDLGVRVTLVLGRVEGPYLDLLSPRVQRQILDRRALRAQLTDFLKTTSPDVAISGKLPDDRTLIDARDCAGVDVRVIFRVGNPLGYRMRERTANPLGRWWKQRKLRQLYARADGYIAVSEGIKEDLVNHLAVPRECIHALPNPAVTRGLLRRTRTRPDHPWFAPGQPPVIVSAGGLRQQKDFPTLIRAFARLRNRRECRLLILGEGRQKERLEKLAHSLSVNAHLQLLGWRPDPHAYMAHAAVFALSSRWEGFGNVLVEAAALGAPIVTTDCPTGPRQITQNGKYGRLVPVGNPAALADAMDAVLDNPPPREFIRQAAEPYLVERSARSYVNALGLTSFGNVASIGDVGSV